MKKRILSSFVVMTFACALWLALTPTCDVQIISSEEQNIGDAPLILEDGVEVSVVNNPAIEYYVREGIGDSQEAIYDEAMCKMEDLDITDLESWFIGYKEIQNEYAEWIDSDETIYDYYTDEEIELFARIIEAEGGNQPFETKVHLASVVLNRVESEKFPDDITSVVSSYNQFSVYTTGFYKIVDVKDSTILAIEYAFQFGDTTDGCLYFDTTNGKSWASRNRENGFSDGTFNYYK